MVLSSSSGSSSPTYSNYSDEDDDTVRQRILNSAELELEFKVAWNVYLLLLIINWLGREPLRCSSCWVEALRLKFNRAFLKWASTIQVSDLEKEVSVLSRESRKMERVRVKVAKLELMGKLQIKWPPASDNGLAKKRLSVSVVDYSNQLQNRADLSGTQVHILFQ